MDKYSPQKTNLSQTDRSAACGERAKEKGRLRRGRSTKIKKRADGLFRTEIEFNPSTEIMELDVKKRIVTN